MANGQVGNHFGTYQIGGLVGFAYDYDISESNNVSAIQNCAISGYVIEDASICQHGRGYASVGGLIGYSQLKLKQCSAVTELRISYHSPDDPNNSGQHLYSVWGNMIRVGGLAGTSLWNIDDCYTGGKIVIDEATLDEKPDGFKENVSTPQKLKRPKALSIFVGGIAGSTYKNGVSNFGKLDSTDGSVTLSNCYTFMTLPSITGTVRSVSIFAGPADRANIAKTSVKIYNCYYLKDAVLEDFVFPYLTDENGNATTMPNTDYKAPDYYFEPLTKPYALDNSTVWDILLGDMDFVGKNMLNNSANNSGKDYKPDSNEETSVTYRQLMGSESITLAGGAQVTMPGALSGVWGWVTREGSASGKYSFSDLPAQAGKDYPFPTVIKQGADVNVHYGAWPIDGAYWKNGRVNMDVFADMQKLVETELTLPAAHGITEMLTGWTYQESEQAFTCAANPALKLKIAPDGAAEVVSVRPVDGEPAKLSVTLRAYKTVEVTVSGAMDETPEAKKQVVLSGPFFAEKLLTLKLTADPAVSEPLTGWTKNDENVWTHEGQELCFTLTPVGYAEVISVAPGAGARELDVTIRALKPGPVTLREESTGASCALTIEAAVKVTSAPTTVSMPEHGQSDPVACFAKSGRRDYTDADAALVSWDFEAEKDKSYNPLFNVDSVSAGKNSFTASGANPGDSFVSVTFHYDYHGVDLTGSVIVPVRTLGYIGFSDGANSVYANRTETASGQSAYPPSGEEVPAFAAPTGADVFLFSPASEGDLQDFVITEIKVGTEASETAAKTVYSTDPSAALDSDYSVFFFTVDGDENVKDKGPGNDTHPEITSDTNYNYYGAQVRSRNASQSVKVWVTLSDPGVTVTRTEGGTEVKEPKTYTLSLENVMAYRYEVSFLKGAENVSGNMRPVGVKAGQALPECSFRKTGWQFAGWNVFANGEVVGHYDDAHVFTAEEVGAFEQDLELVAAWEPIQYQVIFHDNAGNETGPVAFTYGVTTLPDPTDPDNPLQVTFDIPTGYNRFDSWNTKADGKGDMYLKGQGDLTDTALTEPIHLYARWKYALTLTLAKTGSSDPPKEFSIEAGTSSLSGYDPADYAAAYTDSELCGWYTTDGAQVLNASGEIIAVVDGYTSDADGTKTFDLQGQNRTLYACWTRTAFLPISRLEDGADGNGKYLIANSGEGTVTLMTMQEPSGQTAQLGTLDAAVRTGTFLDAAGNLHENERYLYTPSGNAVWTATYCNVVDNNKSFEGHRFSMPVGEKDYYLRRHDDIAGGAAKLIATDYTTVSANGTGGVSDRYFWHFDAAGFWVKKDSTGKTLGLNGTTWQIKAGYQCAVFREQSIFSFNPATVDPPSGS